MTDPKSILPLDVLIGAYCQGYFPMPETETGRLLWFNPDPRAILPLDGFHCSRSFRRFLRQTDFTHTFDKDFSAVIRACAQRADTWINDEMIEIYTKLYDLGLCHSIEVWKDNDLVGGLYGLALGGVFFAESKFHRSTNASKYALFQLVEHLKHRQFSLLEVQFLTPHLQSLGACEISKSDYLKMLESALTQKVQF